MPNIDQRVLFLARILWDFLVLKMEPIKADVILVLGSVNKDVARRGAELLINGYAPKILFSGKSGHYTEGVWEKTEAETFAEIARELGVQEDQIIIEKDAKNTGENITFSYEKLRTLGVKSQKILLVNNTHMERRTLATFLKQWPDKSVEFAITSPENKFEDLPNIFDYWVDVLVGTAIRIKEYPKLGYQIEQEIPMEVEQASVELKEMGFDRLKSGN